MNETNSSVVLSFTYTELPLKELARCAARKEKSDGNFRRSKNIAFWTILFLMLLALINVFAEFGELLVGLFVGIAVSVVGWSALGNSAVRRHYKAFVAAPSRKGPVTITMNDAGLLMDGRGMHYSISWQVIHDVIDAPRHLLVMPSDVEFVPIPHASLAPDLTPEALRAQIAAWRAAAVSAPPE